MSCDVVALCLPLLMAFKKAAIHTVTACLHLAPLEGRVHSTAKESRRGFALYTCALSSAFVATKVAWALSQRPVKGWWYGCSLELTAELTLRAAAPAIASFHVNS